MNNQHTIIFIGRSGCGKSTQSEKIHKLFNEHPDFKDSGVFYLQTGDAFREFAAQNGYTNELARLHATDGKRQPDFLAVWMWTHLFVSNLKMGQNIILDGTPRSIIEAGVMDTTFDFYGLKGQNAEGATFKPFIVDVHVSRKWAEDRLIARHRDDDKEISAIERRLKWYETDVEPVLEHYKNSADVNYVKINGEQSIDEVHAEIMRAIGLEKYI
jgi:adenylate kinase family enzyme